MTAIIRRDQGPSRVYNPGPGNRISPARLTFLAGNVLVRNEVASFVAKGASGATLVSRNLVRRVKTQAYLANF